MADDDYESLGDGASFTANAIAGASAGYFEVTHRNKYFLFKYQASMDYRLFPCLQGLFQSHYFRTQMTRFSALGRVPNGSGEDPVPDDSERLQTQIQ